MRKNTIITFGFITSILLASASIQISIIAYAQTQQESQSLVNRLCQIVQDNSFLAIISGLTEALAICTGLTALNTDQALTQLCSLIERLGIISTDAICGQQTTSQPQIKPQEERNNNTDSLTPLSKLVLEGAQIETVFTA